MYQGARTLRLADGPDEVRKILIAKNVLGRYRGHEQGWDFGNQDRDHGPWWSAAGRRAIQA